MRFRYFLASLLLALLFAGEASARGTLDSILPEIRAQHPGRLSDAEPWTDSDGNTHYRIKWMTPEGRILYFNADAETGRFSSGGGGDGPSNGGGRRWDRGGRGGDDEQGPSDGDGGARRSHWNGGGGGDWRARHDNGGGDWNGGGGRDWHDRHGGDNGGRGDHGGWRGGHGGDNGGRHSRGNDN